MKWLRSLGKRLSLLALFALAMQLGLSFGHFHHDAARAGHTEISDHASGSSHDTDHDSKDHRDLCAICVTVALANAPIDAPPTLPLPVATNVTGPHPAPDAATAALTRAGFRARAPPQS